MTAVLVINSGSSSFKYQLIAMETEEVLASGLIERIGEESGSVKHFVLNGGGDAGSVTFERELLIADHEEGFRLMLESFSEHGPSLVVNAPLAVGHRVVHGGKQFLEPTVITDQVKVGIRDLFDLAPLHNPANLQGIIAAQRAFPHVSHVAVFDTAFHHSLSPAAYTYAIPVAAAEKHNVRRYGFHGTSHKFVSERVAQFLETPVEKLKTIVLHLGNGASVCAVNGGRSFETSMGLTPLEGLVMGTRSGDIDPAAIFYLHRKTGLGFDQLDDLFNQESGLLGLSGHSDMRDVGAAAKYGDKAALRALDVYCHRIKHYVGAYIAQLGHVDVIAFTAGVGENSAPVRAQSLARLEGLGIWIDPDRNETSRRGTRVISADNSRVTVLVVPTNEELEIARQALSVVQ